MSKLIIPAAEIIGTPLTPEELKGILAGAINAKTCKCSYNGTESTIKISPMTQAECQRACSTAAHKGPVYSWCATFDREFCDN